MLLFTSILGAFLSLLLLWYNARRNTSNIYLGFFFLLVSLYEFYQYALVYSKSVALVEVILVLFALITPPLYLIGPLLYWYVRSVLTDNTRLQKQDFWHLLPMIIYFAASLHFMFLPFSEKAEAAMEVVKDAGYLQTYKATFLSEIFPVPVVFMSRPVLVLLYSIWSGILLWQYSFSKKLNHVITRQRFMQKWLSVLIGSVFTLVITQSMLIRKVFALNFSDVAFTISVIWVISLTGLFILLISPFLYPTILYGLPRVPVKPPADGEEEVTGCAAEPESKPMAAHYEMNYLQCIENKICTHMEEHEPYLHSQFNISQLSVQLGIPVHHLGYYFREVKKESFTEYRNRWRVEHAKKLIAGGRMNALTLEAIAELSGFSNRNAFRTTFQRMEGVPPSVFAARVKEEAIPAQ